MTGVKFKNQKEMFEFIWNNRPHVSEISGKPLVYPNQPFFIWQMAHVLGKGAYPRYKLNPDNIMLMTKEEHEKQEDYEVFRARRDALKARYYKEQT